MPGTRRRAAPRRTAAPKSVVLSVRVAPETAAKLQHLSEETGLSQGAVVALALDHVAETPDVQELIAASRAWTTAMARVRGRRRKAATTVAER
jgi:malonyl CoA-acyl carrier protein transacylase